MDAKRITKNTKRDRKEIKSKSTAKSYSILCHILARGNSHLIDSKGQNK